MNRPRLRSAVIIGCGDIAGGYDERARSSGVFSHAGSYRAHASRIRLVGCVEPDPARRRAFQDAWNVPHAYAAVEDLLRDIDADIVSICSPDSCHAEHLRAVIEARRARIVWAEKPLTVCADEAKSLVTLAADAGIGIRLTNQRRWEPAHSLLAHEIRTGSLGCLRSVIGYYVKGITHIGTTMINTLRLLVGEIRQVQAVEPFAGGAYPGDPSLGAVVWFDCGVTGMIRGVDGDRYSYSLFEIEIVGTEGRARVVANGDAVEIERPTPYRHYGGFSELCRVETRPTAVADSMVSGLERMLCALDEGTETDLSEANEGVRDLTVVKAIRASARAGGLKQIVAS